MGSADSSVSPWFSNASLTSPEVRHGLAAAFSASPGSALTPDLGVLPGGGATEPAFLPTSNGSGGAPSVAVSPGRCIVQSTVGHTYTCTLPSPVTVALATPVPAAGTTRIDVLCGRVLDTEADAGGVVGTFRLETVTGTASASPAAPAVPAGYLPLFRMTLNNAGAISAITSARTWARGAAGLRLVEAGDTVPGSFPGDMRRFRDGQVDSWAGGSWITVVDPTAWTVVPIAWTSGGSAGGGTGSPSTVNFGTGASICRYKLVGNDLTCGWVAHYGAGWSTGSGALTTVLPGGMTTVAQRQVMPAHLYVNDAASGLQTDWYGFAYFPPSSSIVELYMPVSNIEVRMRPHLLEVTPGVVGESIPQTPGGFAGGGDIVIGPGLLEVAP